MRRTVQEADLAVSVLKKMGLAITRFTVAPDLVDLLDVSREEHQDVYKISELLRVIRPMGKQRIPRLQGIVTGRVVNLSAWHDQGFANQDGLAGLLGLIFIDPPEEGGEELATLHLSTALYPKFSAALRKARKD